MAAGGTAVSAGSLTMQNENGNNVTGFLVTSTLTAMLPACQWASGSYPLKINVVPTSGFIAPATNNPQLTISPTALVGSIYTTDASNTTLNHGDSIVIDGTANPTDPTNGNVPVSTVNDPSALPNLGGLQQGTSPGQVSGTTNAAGTKDNFLYH
jgi:hypothetical protein